jgi:predicted RNA-binding Zn-ribbon protein involved in translation (DUF1610 family)
MDAMEVFPPLVIGAQLLIPLLAGARPLRDLALDRRPPRAVARSAPPAALAPTEIKRELELLRCAACGAAVPLSAERFPCPFCRAAITPPAQWVELLRLRARAREDARKAVTIWRRSRFLCSPVTTWGVRLLAPVWALAVFAACVVRHGRDESSLFDWVALLTMLTGMVCVYPLASALDDIRRAMPVVPPRALFAIPDQQTTCGSCGAPVEHLRGTVASECDYCGATTYRAEYAAWARDDAAVERLASSSTLRQAIDDVRERRLNIEAMVVILAIGELFFLVLTIVGAIF